MHLILAERISHKSWRKLIKRERRRQHRIKVAQEKEKEENDKLQVMLLDPDYVAQLKEAEQLQEEQEQIELDIQQQRKEEWVARDLALHSLWKKQKEKKLKLFEELRQKQEQSLASRPTIDQNGPSSKDLQPEVQEEIISNPEPPPGYRRNVTVNSPIPCPFFKKTGACRFGPMCSREHEYPSESKTVLFPNMYTHFGLKGDIIDDYDTDIALEFSENEYAEHFRDFFEDTLNEFKRCGRVVEMKVCSNKSAHLKGNVYVEYKTPEAASKAVKLFNGRWYAGRQLSCFLVTIDKWNSAICGLYWSKRCPKGQDCNFLHVYKNPRNFGEEFYYRGRERSSSRSERSHYRSNSSTRRSSRSSNPSSERSNRSVRHYRSSRKRKRRRKHSDS